MNWDEAVAAMRKGESVQRKSEQYRLQDDSGHWLMGEEPMRLSHAWTDDERAVAVFQGVSSKELFVPTDEHRNAIDYVIVPNTKTEPQ